MSPIFTFLGTLKWFNFSKKICQNILLSTSFQTKRPFEDSPSGFKIRFQPYSDALRCNAAFAILYCAEAAVPESIVRLYVVVTVTDLVIRPRGR